VLKYECDQQIIMSNSLYIAILVINGLWAYFVKPYLIAVVVHLVKFTAAILYLRR
jgi:hypothetical protein